MSTIGARSWSADVYIVDNVGDVVIEAHGGGSDTVRTTLNSYALNEGFDAGVDDLIFIGVGNFTGTSDSGVNWIYGGAGNDVFDGSAGADELYGYGDNDSYYFDDDLDLAFEDSVEESTQPASRAGTSTSFTQTCLLASHRAKGSWHKSATTSN